MKLADSLKSEREWARAALKACNYVEAHVFPLEPRFTKDVGCSIMSNSIGLWTSNREDLQVLLELATMWEKCGGAASIGYRTTVGDDITLTIYAEEGALPPTCRVVFEEVLVPSHYEKKTRVVCDP